MISDAQYTAWLSDPTAIRTMLFEVVANIAGVDTTLYLSAGSYPTTSPTDTPANTVYQPIVSAQGLQIVESISLVADGSLSVGTLDVYNLSGERDAWLGYIWTNKTLKAWIGDVRWARSDFRMVFNGIVSDIQSKARDRVNLVLMDKLQMLNTAMSDVKLGGDVTYTQAGTTVTITKVNHGRHIGSPIEIHVTSGTAVSGTYAVLATPTINTFTYTAGTSLTTSGNITIGGVNADSLLPIVLGEGHNTTPLLTDAVIEQYQAHGGPTDNIQEVRDSGKKISVTAHNDTGKFELLAPAIGAITVSLRGDSPGGASGNTISKLIQRAVTAYGKVTGPFASAPPFTSADLDATNLAAFDTAHPQPIGLVLNDRANVLDACHQMASSVGAQMVMSRLGLLQLLQINFPPSGTPTPITQSDQLDRTLQVVARTPVAATVKLGYNQNWTVEDNLLTNIPADQKELFSEQWLTVTSNDPAVQAAYKLGAEPVQQDTCLLTRADAQIEADRRLAIFKVTRTTYRFEGKPSMMALVLGQAVTLYSPRFGLAAGQLGTVTSLTPNWLNSHVTVEVMI